MDEQRFGKAPLKVRDTSHYRSEYTSGFVEHWDQVASWEIRDKYEKNFYEEILKRYSCKEVLDVATGTGYHSSKLSRLGFEVLSLDGCNTMLNKAKANGKNIGILLETLNCDWKEITPGRLGRMFDAVICLGNSFTHVFDSEERVQILENFRSVLKPEGILIIDHRNYDSIVKGIPTKKAQYYAGASAKPDHIDEGLARYKYEFKDGNCYYLNMFPITRDVLVSEAIRAKFRLEKTLYDLVENKSDDAAFVQHVFRSIA